MQRSDGPVPARCRSRGTDRRARSTSVAGHADGDPEDCFPWGIPSGPPGSGGCPRSPGSCAGRRGTGGGRRRVGLGRPHGRDRTGVASVHILER